MQNNGCYSLVGENRFTSISLGDGGLVSETPEPSNIISLQPGDVMGYYTFNRIDPENIRKYGLQLDTDYTDDIVWYLADINTDLITIEATNCPLPVGDRPDRLLSTYLEIVFIVFTFKFYLFASVKLCAYLTSFDLNAQHKKKNDANDTYEMNK